jgi:serine protease Do
MSLTTRSLAPGSTVQLGVVHRGTETMIAVVLAETPPPPTGTAPIERPPSPDGAVDLGLMLAAPNTSPGGNNAGQIGVVVLAVQPDGLGADLGIAPGDLILDVNGNPVQTPDEVRQALQGAYAAGRPATLMRLRSGDTTRFIAVPFNPA